MRKFGSRTIFSLYIGCKYFMIYYVALLRCTQFVENGFQFFEKFIPYMYSISENKFLFSKLLSFLFEDGRGGDYTVDTISHCSRTTKTTIFCFKEGNLQFQSTNNKTFVIFLFLFSLLRPNQFNFWEHGFFFKI